MGERKVLNKYYPPDFDPAKIPKRKQLKNLQMKVRMMLPMSVCCNTCGQFMYKGTKFNCRKEDVQGETYLGLMKFRFYFKCVKCSAELCMKTDPQNSDYEMEFGASRNFEPWREADEVKEAAKKAREEEEMGDAMKALENRTMDSKMEMDILAGLDEVKSLRARQAHLDQDELLAALQRGSQQEQQQQQRTLQQLEEEDEKLAKALFAGRAQAVVKRLDSDEESDEGEGGEERAPGRGGGKPGTSIEGQSMASASSGLGAKRDLEECDDGDRKRLKDEGDPAQKPIPGVPSLNTVAEQTKAVAKKGNALGPQPDTLLIKKAEEAKPIFAVKPVKVAFAVKEKKAAAPAAKLPAKQNGSGSRSGASGSGSASASVASGSGSGGLSLLTQNYEDSDEGSE